MNSKQDLYLSDGKLLRSLILLFVLVYGLAAGTAAAQTCVGIPAQECAALHALYDAAGGSNWLNNSLWKSMAPVSQWDNVTVENGHVTELGLSTNQLIGEIPPEIGDLTFLVSLDFTGNYLYGEIPDQISQLTELEYLSLWDNRLWGPIPPGISGLTKLQWLDLSANYLSGTIPEDIGLLTDLEYLWIENNLLTGGIPDSISSLENLSVLSLYTNQLEGQIPAGIGNLPSLARLYLDGNYLSGPIPSNLGNLGNLTQLALGDNRLTGSIPTSLHNLSGLQYLSLRNNLLTGGIDPGISGLLNLSFLDLSMNRLTGTIPESIGALPALSTLKLNGNNLTGAIPQTLGNLFALQNLSLHENQLSGSIPPQLQNLQNLTRLALHGNQLEGEIPEEIGNLSALNYLYLGNNKLSGEIPDKLGFAGSLRFLGLSNNRLEGTVPSTLGNLQNIRGLWASGNMMAGELPGFLTNPPESVDLRWNRLRSSNNNILVPMEERHGNSFISTQTLTPDNLIATVAGESGEENRVDLTWDPIDYTDNDGGYEIFFRQSGNTEYIRAGMTGDKEADSYTIPDLEPGADYTFKVRSITWEHDRNPNALTSPELETAPVTAGSTSRAFIPSWKRGSDKFTGVVVSNFGQEPFNLEMTAYRESGNPESTGSNPFTGQVEANHQYSLLGTEFFGSGPYPSDLSWIEVKAENSNKMGSLFLFGVKDTSMLDGAESQTRYAKKLFFTRPLEEGILDQPGTAIELSVLNPFDEALTVRFSMISNGVSLESGDIQLPARGFFAGTAEQIFGTGHGMSDAYICVETTDGPGIVGFARIEIPGIRTSLGLNAMEANHERLLYSAQMAGGDGIVTSIRLVNTSSTDKQLKLRAVADDGSLLAPEIQIQIPARSAAEKRFARLFGLNPAGIVVGSLEVESSGSGIIGDVVFADGDSLEYALALPLQTTSFKEAVFNHVANIPGVLFTGIALYNPGIESADVEITVYGIEGDPIAEAEFRLDPGERLSRTLTDPDMWPSLPVQSGGYIKIISSKPVIGQQLFGDADLRYMAAIPPTIRLEPIFETGD